MDRFMMDAASVVLCNLAGILTKHLQPENGKSFLPAALFLHVLIIYPRIHAATIWGLMSELLADGQARMLIDAFCPA